MNLMKIYPCASLGSYSLYKTQNESFIGIPGRIYVLNDNISLLCIGKFKDLEEETMLLLTKAENTGAGIKYGGYMFSDVRDLFEPYSEHSDLKNSILYITLDKDSIYQNPITMSFTRTVKVIRLSPEGDVERFQDNPGEIYYRKNGEFFEQNPEQNPHATRITMEIEEVDDLFSSSATIA